MLFEDHLLVVLIKLKLHLYNQTESDYCKYLQKMVPCSDKIAEFSHKMAEKQVLKKNIVKVFFEISKLCLHY